MKQRASYFGFTCGRYMEQSQEARTNRSGIQVCLEGMATEACSILVLKGIVKQHRTRISEDF